MIQLHTKMTIKFAKVSLAFKRFFMTRTFTVCLTILLSCFNALAISAEEQAKQNECEKEIDTVYLVFNVTNKNANDLIEQYQNKIESLNNMAVRLKLEGFQVLNQEVNVNPSSFKAGNFDGVVSVTLAFEGSYKGVAGLLAEAGAVSFTTSRHRQYDCGP